MNQAVYHLIVFLSCLIAITVLILTGHDNSPLLQHLTEGLFGGVLGGSAAGAAPLILKFLAGPGNGPGAGATTKQAGFTRLIFLAVLLAVGSLGLAACASFTAAAKVNPLATACASGSASLKVLTAAEQAGKLNLTDTAAVNDAVAVLTPACATPIEPSPSQATMLAVNGAIARLATLATPYQAAGQP